MPESLNLVQRRRSHLQESVGHLGARVVEALHRSVECLKTQDRDLAAVIIAGDQIINQQRRLLEQAMGLVTSELSCVLDRDADDLKSLIENFYADVLVKPEKAS